MKLSVILPTIRLNKIETFYNSFIKSYTGEFELIVVSPFDYKPGVWSEKPCIWIKDFGSPLRAQQLGLTHTTGEYIHRSVDDSYYLPGSMDKCMNQLIDQDYKTLVNVKFIEGENVTHRDMANPNFYNMEYHIQTLAAYTPFNYQVINFSIVSNKFIQELGGWDCQFETIAIGELDLSLRLQFMEAKVLLSDNIVVKCDWLPGVSGDHAPMHYGFFHDMEKYKRIYGSLEYEKKLIVDINNWKNSSEKWERRWGQ